MKKQILMMALCVSTLMPVTVFGEEAAVQNVSTVNKEETASGDENPKIEESEVTAVNDTVTVAIDADILDYPGKKEGNIIGEVLEGDEISRTGTISDAWSRILFEDEKGKMQTGYIPTSYLEGYGENSGTEESAEAGVIHKSSGKGIFADAVEGVTQTGGDEGVMEGEAVMASADSSLRSLGNFIITHYCPCSICCAAGSERRRRCSSPRICPSPASRRWSVMIRRAISICNLPKTSACRRTSSARITSCPAARRKSPDADGNKKPVTVF